MVQPKEISGSATYTNGLASYSITNPLIFFNIISNLLEINFEKGGFAYEKR